MQFRHTCRKILVGSGAAGRLDYDYSKPFFSGWEMVLGHHTAALLWAQLEILGVINRHDGERPHWLLWRIVHIWTALMPGHGKKPAAMALWSEYEQDFWCCVPRGRTQRSSACPPELAFYDDENTLLFLGHLVCVSASCKAQFVEQGRITVVMLITPLFVHSCQVVLA